MSSYSPSLSPIPEKKKVTFAKPNLVLDLDHTLICSSPEYLGNFKTSGYKQYKFSFLFQNEKHVYHCYIRPGVKEFLKDLSEHYNIYVFTASVLEYAKKVVALIDPDGYIKKIYDRRYLAEDGKNTVTKSLEKIRFDLRNTIIVDDRKDYLILNPANAILIPPFVSKDKYDVLLSIKTILFAYAIFNSHKDVRVYLEKYPWCRKIQM